MTVQDIPELRIVEQEVWGLVQERLRASAEKAKGRNPRQAARKTYLLSGLLECAC